MQLLTQFRRRVYRLLGIVTSARHVDYDRLFRENPPLLLTGDVDPVAQWQPHESACVTACGLPKRTPGLALTELRNGSQTGVQRREVSTDPSLPYQLTLWSEEGERLYTPAYGPITVTRLCGCGHPVNGDEKGCENGC